MLTNLNNFLQQLPELLGVFLLMLSTFLLGYFGGLLLQKRKKQTQLRKLEEELSELKSTAPTRNDDIETLFSEIKPRIIEVVKQTQQAASKQDKSAPEWSQSKPEKQKEKEENAEKEAAPPGSVAQKARATFIKYNIEKPELNFNSIGYADNDQKDDLTRVMGIGPYIEQKLNEIGIYNYDQISRLNEADIQVITELIDFFPGRIERDNWVGQAKALKVS